MNNLRVAVKARLRHHVENLALDGYLFAFFSVLFSFLPQPLLAAPCFRTITAKELFFGSREVPLLENRLSPNSPLRALCQHKNVETVHYVKLCREAAVVH